jgi:serine/alanine adding enzyme
LYFTVWRWLLADISKHRRQWELELLANAVFPRDGNLAENVRVSVCTSPEGAQRWQEFVDTQGQAGKYHCWRWKQIIENTFFWPTFYLMAESGGTITGVLPLVWLKNRIFGNFISSLPYVTTGGILAVNAATEQELLFAAINLAKRLKAEFLELRHHCDHGLGLPAKTNKAMVLLPLSDPELMWKKQDKKSRNEVKKATSLGLTMRFGGRELLDDFYAVFAQNMRDLGTPVYSRQFFAEIFDGFPSGTYVCTVQHRGETVAASFLSAYLDVIECCWSASIRRCLSLKPNMFLTWNMLCFAAHRGYKLFNYGRSTIASGPYNYKMQWAGAESVPLHWTYWLRNGNHLPGLNPDNPKYRLAIRVWQKLPLKLTTTIGPRIVRYLP